MSRHGWCASSWANPIRSRIQTLPTCKGCDLSPRSKAIRKPFHPAANSMERKGNLTIRFFGSARPAQLAVASGMSALRLLVKDCVEVITRFFENLGQSPNIVHAHDWQCFLAGSEIAAKMRVPLVSTIHLLSEPMERLCGAIAPEGVRSSEQRLCRESSATITVSQSERRTLIEKYGADPVRTWTVLFGQGDALGTTA